MNRSETFHYFQNISHHLSLNQHTIISATMLLFFNGFDITLKTSSMTYQVHLSNFYQGNIDIRCVHNLLSVVRSEQMMSFIYDTESRQSKFQQLWLQLFSPLKKSKYKIFKEIRRAPPPLQKGEIFLFTLFFSTFMAFLNYVLNNLNNYTIKYMLTINCTITQLRCYTMESPLCSLLYQQVLHGIQGLLLGVSPSAQNKCIFQFVPVFTH